MADTTPDLNNRYPMFKEVALFAGLPEEHLRAVEDCAVTKAVKKNTILVSEGDNTDSLYLILSGKLKVFVSDQEGREVTLNLLGAGEYFGELAPLDSGPRSASVMALEACKLAVISKANLQQCLTDHPAIALELIRDLVRRIRDLTDNVRTLALLDVYGRIARTLLQLAVEQDGKLMITEKLTHQDIASMVGASREMVSRIMKDLRSGGYISVEGKQITINEKLPSGW